MPSAAHKWQMLYKSQPRGVDIQAETYGGPAGASKATQAGVLGHVPSADREFSPQMPLRHILAAKSIKP